MNGTQQTTTKRLTDREINVLCQPSVREINAHLASMKGYCMVYGDGWQMRISRARTRNGVTEGRVVNHSISVDDIESFRFTGDWAPIPATAVVELF